MSTRITDEEFMRQMNKQEEKHNRVTHQQFIPADPRWRLVYFCPFDDKLYTFAVIAFMVNTSLVQGPRVSSVLVHDFHAMHSDYRGLIDPDNLQVTDGDTDPWPSVAEFEVAMRERAERDKVKRAAEDAARKAKKTGEPI